MKLYEYLQTVDEDTVMFIGSKSNFLFIGTKAEYEKYFERTVSRYYKIAERSRQESIRFLNEGVKARLKSIFEHALPKIPEYTFDPAEEKTTDTAVIKQMYEDSIETLEVVRGLAKSLGHYEEAIKREGKRFLNSREYINTFKEYEDREILEIYERLERDGIVILIEGLESGGFWMEKEYKKLIAEFDKEDKENGTGDI